MEKLRCIGCKASLIPADKATQFITCEYCRKTNKNPKFKEMPVPTVTMNQDQKFNQQSRENTQSTNHTQHSRNEEAFIPFLTSLLMPRRVRRRNRFRRRGCSCSGCGCGCLIFLLMIFGLLAFVGYIFVEEITELVYRLVEAIR